MTRHGEPGGGPEAFYRPLGDGWFEATEATAGPWSPDHQHGGPPVALVARAIGRLPGPDAPIIARLTCEIVRPIPVGRLRVEARVLRGGRNVQLVEAALEADGAPVLLARAWRMRTESLPLPAAPEPSPPPLPDEPTPAPGPWGSGYARSVEWRFVEGGFRPGPAVAWGRPLPALVAGEEAAAVERLLVLADAGSGLGAALDFGRWTFVNTELTVHLARAPVGEWFCLDATTSAGQGGVAVAETRLWDRRGPVGRGAQALLVKPR